MSVAMMKKGGRAWSDIVKSCHWGRERISSIYKQGLFSPERPENVGILAES